MKVCTGCKKLKTLNNFFIVKSGKRAGKPFPKCKNCEASRSVIYRKNNRSKLRDYQLRVNYNININQLDYILKLQNGKCRICNSIITTPYVDHDHKCCPGIKSCGECIRGILCRDCNSGIGFLKDDIKLLSNAIDYLEDGYVSIGLPLC